MTPLPLQGARFGEALRIAGAHWTAGPLAWTRALGMRVDWAGLAESEADLTAFLHLTDAEGRLWGQVDLPIAAFAEDPLWAELIEGDPFRLKEPPPRLPFDVAAAVDTGRQDLLLYAWPGTPPGRYQAWLGVYRSADGARLPLRDLAPGARVEGDRVLLGEVTVERPAVQPTTEELAIPTAFFAPIGDLHLLGAALPGSAKRAGESAAISLFWEVRDPASLASLELHVTLVSSDGRVPAGPALLPSSPLIVEPVCRAPCDWQAGDRLRTQHTIQVPNDLAPGRYSVTAALAPGGTPIRIGEIEIAAP